MGSYRARSTVVTVGLATAICVLTLTADSAQAQQTGPPPPGNRDPFGEARERQQREAQLRSAEMVGAVKTTDRRGSEAAAEQMKQDFRNIQILRNKLARHLLSDKPLDYKFIAAETEEVNKRANRLKTYLVREAAVDEKKEQQKPLELDGGRMKSALVALCKRIDGFTENPLFKVPAVVDVEQSAKAGRDIQIILILSDGIKKSAERLHKAPGK